MSPASTVGNRTPLPSRVEVAVFAAGVASMGLEILAGRLLAPDFGSSIFVWGSVIGVFLAALTAGYWLAGRRASSHASLGALALALVTAAGYVAVVVVAAEPLLDVFAGLGLPARFAPLLPVTVLFGPPTVLLGFVSPYAAELVEATGRGDASGQVYALGTAGSIVGAFGTTFLLLPELGVLGSELVFGVVLIGAAALVAPGSAVAAWAGVPAVSLAFLVAFGAAAGVSAGPEVVHTEQTAYQELRIVDDGDVRTMYLDGGPQSAMDLGDPDRYVFEYSAYVHLPFLFADGGTADIDRVLFVGGGGFSSPKRFVSEYDVTVDVVELDPRVVDNAKRYFGVEESPDLRIHTADGRVFLQETEHTYDLIVLDAYRSTRVPYHLTTVEFMELARSKLDEDGVLFANLISSTEGADSVFYRAEYRTMDRVFPTVYSFPTARTDALQNIELVATTAEDRVSRATLRTRNAQRDIGIDLSGPIARYTAEVAVGDAPLLRDGAAPVDRLLANQVATEYVIERTANTTATAAPTAG